MTTSRIASASLVLLMVTTTVRAATVKAQQASSEAVELSAGPGTVYGTLLLPRPGKSPMPVVLLISGSGPTDRDGNSKMLPGPNNSLKLLAEGLAEREVFIVINVVSGVSCWKGKVGEANRKTQK